jgi:hypothetical protein
MREGGDVEWGGINVAGLIGSREKKINDALDRIDNSTIL